MCPHAWLHLVCSSSLRFGEFLVERLGHGLSGSTCSCPDDVMPGNALRPDRGRQFLAIYWGIPQMPDWFRSRAGWLNTLSLVPCTALKEIEGGLSALYVKVLECFWHPQGYDMQRLGVRVPVGGSLVHLHFSFSFYISDERAEEDALGLKGAAATKM